MVEFTSPAAAKLYFANTVCSGQARLAVAEHGYSLRYTDPKAMLAWCEAAAFNLPPSLPAEETGVLLAYLANAHRVTCNFGEAGSCLKKALASAPRDPVVLQSYATYLKETGDLDTAADFLRRAGTVRQGASDSTLVVSLLEFAVVLNHAGLPERSVDNTLGALDIIASMPESEERERLARVALLNLAKNLVDAGRPQEALRILELCRERLELGGEFFCLRVDWLMADITGAFGEVEHAVASYQQVRDRFATLGKLREAALVTLDIARLLLKPRPLQAREEALSVYPILESLGLGRAREAKLLAEVVEKRSEAALIELAAALRTLARSTGASLPVPGTS